MRMRRGKATYGQHGDVAATDPVGDPLLKLCAIEIKRGYSRRTFADMLDQPAHAKKHEWEAFVHQAQRSASAMGSMGWLLITRRDKRECLVFMPTDLFNGMRRCFGFRRPVPFVQMRVNGKGGTDELNVCGTTLTAFCSTITPGMVLAFVEPNVRKSRMLHT